MEPKEPKPPERRVWLFGRAAFYGVNEMGNRYIEASKRVIARAEQHPDRLNAPCAECKWRGKYSGGGDYHCDNPVVVLGAETTPDSHAREMIRGINQQRNTRSIYGEVVCGPEGVLWEPRETFGWLATLLGR